MISSGIVDVAMLTTASWNTSAWSQTAQSLENDTFRNCVYAVFNKLPGHAQQPVETVEGTGGLIGVAMAIFFRRQCNYATHATTSVHQWTLSNFGLVKSRINYGLISVSAHYSSHRTAAGRTWNDGDKNLMYLRDKNYRIFCNIKINKISC